MTNKTINGVPRELIEQSATLLDAHSSGPSIESNLAADLRALLAAPDPIVEADGIGEPVGLLLIDEYFDNREIGDVDVQLDKEVCERLATDYPGQSIDLYSADQLAALQSTIAQLKAENERIQRVSDNYSALLMDANAENERLRGGLKLPERVEPNFYGEYNPHDSGWNESTDEVRRMNDSLKSSK